MRGIRRTLAGVLAGAVILGAAPLVLAGREDRQEHRFRDWQESHWANGSMARLVLMGVLKGNADGTIAPNRPVTRLEAAIMLARYLGLEPSGDYSAEVRLPGGKWVFRVDGEQVWLELKARGSKFEARWEGDQLVLEEKSGRQKLEFRGQVPEWGRSAVAAALEHGFLVTDDRFLNIRKPLSRLEAAMMLVKAAGLDAEAQARAAADLAFADGSAVPSRLRGYVEVAVEAGLIQGYPDGTFRPHKPVTRAEWAALLDRFDRGAVETPDQQQVRGSISAVGQGSVRIGQTTYQMAADGWIFVEGRQATLADLRVGDQAILHLNAQGRVELLLVTRRGDSTETAAGLLVAIVPASGSQAARVGLQAGSQVLTYAVAPDVSITWNGEALALTDLSIGDEVRLAISGGLVTAIQVLEREEQQAGSRSGTVVSVDAGDGSLVLNVDGTLTQVEFDSSTAIRLGTLAVEAGALAAGQTVTATGHWDGGVLLAAELQIDARSRARFLAGVSRRTGSHLTVEAGGTTATFPLAAGLTVEVLGLQLPVLQLEAGDTVAVTVEDGRVTAAELVGRAAVSYSGVVLNLDTAAETFDLVVVGPTVLASATATVRYDDATAFRTGAGAETDASALANGQLITVAGSLHSRNQVNATLVTLP